MGASTARFQLACEFKKRYLCKIALRSNGSSTAVVSVSAASQNMCNLFVGVTTLVNVIKKCPQDRIEGVCAAISTGIGNAHARCACNAPHVHRGVQCVSCKGLGDFHTRPRRQFIGKPGEQDMRCLRY